MSSIRTHPSAIPTRRVASAELKYGLPSTGAYLDVIKAFAPHSAEEQWLNVVLDTPGSLIRKRGAVLCLRATRGSPVVLLLKGLERGSQGVSRRPLIWSFFPDSALRAIEGGEGFSARVDPLPRRAHTG